MGKMGCGAKPGTRHVVQVEKLMMSQNWGQGLLEFMSMYTNHTYLEHTTALACPRPSWRMAPVAAATEASLSYTLGCGSTMQGGGKNGCSCAARKGVLASWIDWCLGDRRV